MANKFVGVDLGTHQVKVAVITAGLRGAQFVDGWSTPVAPASDDPEADPLGMAIAAALNLLKSRRLLGDPLTIALPAASMSYRVLAFPFADERRIAQAVGFEVEGQFPIAIDDLAHGHVVVPTPDGGRALVAATRRERLDQIVGIFRRAGADVRSVTAGALALAQIVDANVPAMTPEMAERGLLPCTLLVELGHAITEFVALGPKGPLAVRVHRRGARHVTAALAKAYGMDVAAAEAAKHQDGFVSAAGPAQDLTAEQQGSARVAALALEPILREIGHTRLWLRATYRVEVGRILLVGGGAELRGVEGWLAERIGLPVEAAHARSGVIKGLEGRPLAARGAAIGAAYGAARRPLVDLYGGRQSDRDGAWVQERMSSLLAIGVTVLAFGALETLAQVKAAEAEREAWAAELEDATTKVFGAPVDAADVGVRLAAAEGEDLMSLVPQRGALEVLAMLSDAAKPQDLASAPPPTYPAVPTFAPGSPGARGDDDDDGGVGRDDGADPAVPGPEVPAGPPPVAPDKGIGMSDSLTISMVDIRERKVELRASARFSSTQDRFAKELAKKPCLTAISKGKVKGEGEVKTFDMTMDNGCYRTEEEAAEGEGTAAAAPGTTPAPGAGPEAGAEAGAEPGAPAGAGGESGGPAGADGAIDGSEGGGR